ncbi:MAG: YraN family protein [Actinobacteria bacterium]|nr:YraN family protein [Actinomycetota bacterium]
MPGRGAGEDRRARVGRAGESAAAEVYRRRGFRVVARNWRCPAGELDLVVSRGALLVFCEVKARTGLLLGPGYEAVTWRKQRKLRQLAELFLAVTRVPHGSLRFDVASVHVPRSGRPSVELYEDAF